MLQGQTLSVHFARSYSSLGTHCVHTFNNLKRCFIMLYAKPWEHPSAVGTLSIVILLSARINSSTCCIVFLSQSQQGNLVRHHLRLSNVLERISLPNCEPLYTTNTSYRKHFFYEYPLHWVLSPTKNRATEFFSSVVHSWSTIAILITVSSL
jgi:hypothetical protein